MIKYSLKCQKNHEFEAWFPSINDFDKQKASGYVECPYCGDKNIEKAIMAPNIKKTIPNAPILENTFNENLIPEKLQNFYKGWREHIAKNYDYVGDKFADEARAIHLGESDERPIYGNSTHEEVRELIEEGVPIAPIPPLANPKGDKDLN